MINLSHSSLSQYEEKCPFSFKLKYIDKIYLDEASYHSVFGHAVHDSLQALLEEKITETELEELFPRLFREKLKKELTAEQIQEILQGKKDRDAVFDMSQNGAMLCAKSIEKLHETFPGFKFIGAEKLLEEPLFVSKKNDYLFKGKIDLVIQLTDGTYVLIDWKTCSWGWTPRQRSDKWKTYQLAYYKHFFSLIEDVDFKDVDTYFALIKRTDKDDFIEFVKVPVGEKKVSNALQVIQDITIKVDKNFFPKNKLFCEKCEYHKTIHCP